MKLEIPFMNGYSACTKLCQGRKAPDWMTNPEYFNPLQAVDMLKMKTPHTYVTSFAALQDASNHRLDNNPNPATDIQDPYPWIELDDPR